MRKLRGNPWAVLTVVSLGFFMTLLDLTIVNIAIPNMITKLHASLDDVLWVLNAYALVLAVLVITAGRLGDLFGPRTMFAAGVALFTVASAACGFAPGPGWLIAFRAVQGLGAAMLMPQTLAMITMVFPADRRGAAFGVWGAVAGAATIAGPTLGGLLVTAFDWRWIFFVNLPIGVIVLAAAFMLIPDLRPGRSHRLDIRGVTLASLALLAICYALVEGQRYNWGKISGFISIPLVGAVGVVLLALFIVDQAVRQRGENEPLIPFELFRSRNYTLMNWVSCTLSIGMLGIFLPLTIYLQSALGYSALKAGLTLMPASLVMIFLAPGVGKLTDKIGGKYILMSGLSLFAIGMGWVVLVADPHSAWYDFLAPLIVAGIGMGGTFAPLTTTAMREIQPRLAGAASGVLNTTRQVGSVIGTAAVGALLQNRLVASLTSEATTRAAALPPSARGPFVNGFRQAASSGLIGGSGSPAAKLPPGTPPSLAAELQRLGAEVFSIGYVHAMRWTMLMPIIVLGLAVLSCFGIRRVTAGRPPAAAPPAAEAKPEPEFR
ncbi:MAG: DHA2 family efflux MFS transporter permease subunit [Streptosporangiaceae bacterium]|nr:DHA2 family efflux MFS transporter permease subunit [Streptosporangiaceae bacterium]